MNSSLRLAVSLVLCLASTGLTPSAARISRMGRAGLSSAACSARMTPTPTLPLQQHPRDLGRVLPLAASHPTLPRFPTAAKNSFISADEEELLDLLTDEFTVKLMLEEYRKADNRLISVDTQQDIASQQPQKEQKRTLAEKLKSKKEELKQAARKRAQEYLENYLKEMREKPLEVWKKDHRMTKEKAEAKRRLKEQIAQLLLKRGGFAGTYFGSRLAPKTSSTAQPPAPSTAAEPTLKLVVEALD